MKQMKQKSNKKYSYIFILLFCYINNVVTK